MLDALSLVTDCRVHVVPNGDSTVIWVDATDRDALGAASRAVGCALTLLGYVGQFYRVNGRKVWPITSGRYGDCRPVHLGWRCGFTVRGT